MIYAFGVELHLPFNAAIEQVQAALLGVIELARPAGRPPSPA